MPGKRSTTTHHLPITKLLVHTTRMILVKKSGKKKTNKAHPQAQVPLEHMVNSQLKVLLEDKELPVYGWKSELIDRLMNPPTHHKPKPWQQSNAKRVFNKALLDPKSPIYNMSVDAIQNSDKDTNNTPNSGNTMMT